MNNEQIVELLKLHNELTKKAFDYGTDAFIPGTSDFDIDSENYKKYVYYRDEAKRVWNDYMALVSENEPQSTNQ